MSFLENDIRSLKGVGEQRAKALAALDIHTVKDLLSHFPRSYEDRTVIVPIAEAPFEDNVCICATVSSPPVLTRIRRGMELVKLRAFDDSGSVDITYFNQNYMRDILRQGESYIFYGKVGGTFLRRTMANPEYESESHSSAGGSIVPRYPLCRGISNKLMTSYVRNALSVADSFPDFLPPSVRQAFDLADAEFAYRNIHFPTDFASLDSARHRLVFEELFVLACALGRMRGERRRNSGTAIPKPDTNDFYSTLRFRPTGAQTRAIDQCLEDMSGGALMNRLVQGDVGSGKTLVAAVCAWAVCRAGHQAAFMAPTEILAQQHLETLRSFMEPFGIIVEKLTGSMTAKEKHNVKTRIASGEVGLVVGTHALITGDVEFADLTLVITDEQHRFGVNQRSALGAKGVKPHTLIMSATPIPRTLALMIYGELDVSIIDELPPGRQKVDTFAVTEDYRARLNGFIEKLVGEGRQVFVVCPMVEENEELEYELKSASEHAQVLKEQFPGMRVECMHGRMKAKEKEEIMQSVVNGDVDILVSTTVIEVGVDVPNAALMIVENAERFGLSQLHQLRGRVGRGKHKSYCVLVSGSNSEESRARLKALCSTNDGFKISEEDLRLRGPGDFFGKRQHGLPEMHIADLGGDVRVFQDAQDAAAKVLSSDPELTATENASLCRRIEELFSFNSDTFN